MCFVQNNIQKKRECKTHRENRYIDENDIVQRIRERLAFSAG